MRAVDPLRVGLCGIGRAGLGMVQRDFLRLPYVKVVAAYDLLGERAQELSQLCGSKCCESFAELLAERDVELVIVATRSSEHVSMAIEVMKAGKDVLVEKPMAIDLVGADKLISAAKKLKRRLYVRQNRRFDLPFLQATEIVASGKLGKLFAVQLRQGNYQRRADWQTLKKFGGGQLLNWGPHLVDWAMQLIGGKAQDVWAELKRITSAGDAEDYVKMMIRGPSGILADIEICGATSIAQPTWILMGTQGTLVIDRQNQCHLRYFDSRKLPKIKASDRTPSGTNRMRYTVSDEIEWIDEMFPAAPAQPRNFWQELHESVRRGIAFEVTLEQVRENMRVVDLAKKQSGFYS
jgi:predicted dehydrogenase